MHRTPPLHRTVALGLGLVLALAPAARALPQMAPGLSLLIGTSMSADVLLPSAESPTSSTWTGQPGSVPSRSCSPRRDVVPTPVRSIARRTRPPSTRNERRRGRWRLAPVGPIIPA